METWLLRDSSALWVILQYPPYLGPLGNSSVFWEMIPQKEQMRLSRGGRADGDSQEGRGRADQRG